MTQPVAGRHIARSRRRMNAIRLYHRCRRRCFITSMGTPINGMGRRSDILSPKFSQIGIAQATIANGAVYRASELSTYRQRVPQSRTR